MSALDSKTILIVEDYEDDAKLLQLLLTNAGIFNPVRTALSAEEAITYLQGVPPYSNRSVHPLPSIIFVDLKLPGIDGFEFLRWLRGHPELKGIFTVILSATGDMLSVQTAYALGANSFLIKPCRAADLENLVACYPAFWTRAIVPPVPPHEERSAAGEPRPPG
jgi:CheY-like chemotaxis protein